MPSWPDWFLENTEIRAPIAGIVAYRKGQEGRLVRIGAPLLSLVPVEQVWVEANFKESQATPMGIFPWLLARLAEEGLWPLAFAVQLLPYGLPLSWPLLSSYWFSGSGAGSGLADMWPAMLVRGITIGILNVTLTIHILRSFPRHQIPEGVALFYQFRTLGSLLAGALFGRLMYRGSQSAVSLLGQSEGLKSGTEYLDLTEQLGQLLLASELKQQALAVAAVNNFRSFILTVLILVPVMALIMRWAKSEETDSQDAEQGDAPSTRGTLLSENSRPLQKGAGASRAESPGSAIPMIDEMDI